MFKSPNKTFVLLCSMAVSDKAYNANFFYNSLIMWIFKIGRLTVKISGFASLCGRKPGNSKLI